MNKACTNNDKRFFTNQKKYTIEEKRKLGKLCIEKKNNGETDYLAKAVQEFYSDLNSVKNSNPSYPTLQKLEKALRLAERSYVLVKNEEEHGEEVLNKRFTQAGGGRKNVVPEIRSAIFEWFIDIRGSLKGRLPLSLFKAQCEMVYENYVKQQEITIPEENRLVFSNKWIQGWMEEYGVSLRKPNKRFQIKNTDRLERISDYLKNIWTVRKFFIDNFGVDPPVINGDQMPLHRNESSAQKTMSFKGLETFVKENYSLSRERITVFTQVILCTI
jgi:hypothetical protein